MKKFYSFLITLLITMTAWSQTRSWNGGNGSWNDATKWTPAGVPGYSDILEFNGTSGTINSVPSFSCKGIIVNSGSIILNGLSGDEKTLTIGVANADTDTSFIVGKDATLTIGNNLNIGLATNARAAIDGVLIVSNNRQYNTSAGETTKTFIKGRLVNSGGIILSKIEMLEFADEAIYVHAGDKGVIPSATWHKNSHCNITGIITNAPGGLNQFFGNYTWDCEHQTGGAFLGTAIPADIRGNLVINKTGNSSDPAVYVEFPDQLKIEGAFTFNTGNSVTKGSNAIINLAGDFNMKGGTLKANATLPNACININFTGTQKQVFSKTGGTIKSVKFAVLNSASLDLGESVLDGEADFTVEAGGTLMTAHPGGIALTGNSGAIQVKGKRVFSSDGDYAYTGITSQITGSGLPSEVRRLIIENRGGLMPDAGVTLSKATIVNTELVLIKGFLQTTKDNILTVTESGDATAFDNSFVVGPMRKAGNTSFTFPTGWVGPGGGRVPIGISLLGEPATIQAEYKRAPATDKGTTINAPLHHISYCGYWELFPTYGNPTAIVTMYHNGYSNCSPVSLINDFSSARVARSNGTSWAEVGNGGDGLNSRTGYVVSGNVGARLNKEEKYYALGNITTATDPLPVMFDNVSAYEKKEGVNIEWSNLTEREIAIYYVERSVNGVDYTIVGQYLPKSNRDDKASYIIFDPRPVPGINFYRIKAIEKSTKIIFSKVMRVETGLQGEKISLYPNPVINKQFILSLAGMIKGSYELRVINATGQGVYQNVLVNKGNSTLQTYTLPSSVKPGIYNLIITGNNYRESKMFIVQ